MKYVPSRFKRQLDRRPEPGSRITTCCMCGSELAVPLTLYNDIEVPVVCDSPDCVKRWEGIQFRKESVFD